jgi:hypothetical protein
VRPLHILSLLHCIAVITTVVFMLKSWMLALLPAMIAVATWLAIRFRYQGTAAFRIWTVNDSVGFVVLPWWYLYWYVRGCLKFGGWKSIL